MFARVSQFQENVDRIDEATRAVQDEIVPQVEGMPGFLGLQSLVNRDTGATLAITFWESDEAMRNSEVEADKLREQAAQLAEGEIRSVERYEVILRVGL